MVSEGLRSEWVFPNYFEPASFNKILYSWRALLFWAMLENLNDGIFKIMLFSYSHELFGLAKIDRQYWPSSGNFFRGQNLLFCKFLLLCQFLYCFRILGGGVGWGGGRKEAKIIWRFRIALKWWLQYLDACAFHLFSSPTQCDNTRAFPGKASLYVSKLVI